jgi:hypothetical protein
MIIALIMVFCAGLMLGGTWADAVWIGKAKSGLRKQCGGRLFTVKELQPWSRNSRGNDAD